MRNGYDPPLKITIPTPTSVARGTGIHSTRLGACLRVRCNSEELALCQEAANILSLPLATFIRQATIGIADAIVTHYRANSDSIEVESHKTCNSMFAKKRL